MKKHIYSIFTLLAVALVGLAVAACSSDDDLDTNQYKAGVKLNAWGPNPVMRGGTLRFVGSNLDQLQSINVPGMGEQTNFQVVKSGTPSEVRLVLDKDLPQVGYITLKGKGGETITTTTQIEYIEGIELTGFSPAEAMPGQTVTLEGDYLNLVEMVEFSDGVQVGKADFVSQERYKLQVSVPAEAKTGKVSVYTADLTLITPDDEEPEYQIITSDEAFIVGLPTVANAEQVYTAKAGSTVAISGTALSLIQAVAFGSVEVTDLTVNDEGTQLSFTLPAEAPDGAISLITRSGVEVPAGQLVSVAPTECVATPSPVKAGQQLVIAGKDMDVVTTVEFADANGEYTIIVEENLVNTPQERAITVPAEAVEGNLILRMANGKGVEVPFTLVKPAATAYSQNPVSAGAELTITGANLDLVQSVTFGEATAEVVATETTITLTVPMAAASGAPKLNLANGTSVEAPELSIDEALFCYIPELPGEDVELKAGQSMSVIVANGDKLTGVQIAGQDCQFVLVNSLTQLIIGIPDKAGKGSELKLISSNGEISYKLDFIPNTEVTTVLWTGAADLAGWSWNWQIGDGTAGASNPNMFVDMDLQEGDVIRIYATAYSDWWQVQFFNGHWENQAEIGVATGLGNGNNINSGIYNLDEHDGAIEITVTATLKEQLTTLNDWGYCWILQGEGVVITKIAVTHYTVLEQTLWSGDLDFNGWGINWTIGDGTAGADNPQMFVEAGLKAGQTIRLYLDAYNDWWQVQFFDGHWGGQAEIGVATGLDNGNNINSGIYNLADHNGAIEIPVTATLAEQLTTLTDWGYCWILQGEGCRAVKITVE